MDETIRLFDPENKIPQAKTQVVLKTQNNVQIGLFQLLNTYGSSIHMYATSLSRFEFELLGVLHIYQ